MNASFMYILYLNFKGANPITKETHPKTDIATTLVVTKSIILILIRNTYHRKKSKSQVHIFILFWPTIKIKECPNSQNYSINIFTRPGSNIFFFHWDDSLLYDNLVSVVCKFQTGYLCPNVYYFAQATRKHSG